MDNSNAENNLVVRKPDGTLGIRTVSSLPLTLTDTVRTLVTDIELANFLCNCNNVPPFLIESALASGYSVVNLVGGGVSGSELLEGGVPINDIVEAGISISDLLSEGVSVQELLDEGVLPIEILNSGASNSEFIGLLYQGGIIYHCTSTGTGLIAALSDQNTGIQWGPIYSDVGAYGTAIGTGTINTITIVDSFGIDVNYAALVCDTLTLNGYTDWYLPSKDELFQMWSTLADSDGSGTNSGPMDPGNLANLAADVPYWSSSEVNITFVWTVKFDVGQLFDGIYGKIATVPRVRAIRSF
jgi:hypothetical protein